MYAPDSQQMGYTDVIQQRSNDKGCLYSWYENVLQRIFADSSLRCTEQENELAHACTKKYVALRNRT
jgi:hypothetical protein